MRQRSRGEIIPFMIPLSYRDIRISVLKPKKHILFKIYISLRCEDTVCKHRGSSLF